jgi:hypothetical protein
MDNDFNDENDPELAEALRLSLEEEKKRLGGSDSNKNMEIEEDEIDEEDDELQMALKLSMQQNETKDDKKDDKMDILDEELYEQEEDEDMEDDEELQKALLLSTKQPSNDENIKDILKDDDFLDSILGTIPNVNKDEVKKKSKEDEEKKE